MTHVPSREQGSRVSGQVGVPARDGFHGSDEIGVGGGLVQKACGTGVEGSYEVLILVVDRDDQILRSEPKVW